MLARNGAITAPPGGLGLGQAARPRPNRFRRAKRPIKGPQRQEAIMQAVARAQQAKRGIGVAGRRPVQPQIGIGGAERPGIGQQLTRRVNEGEIDMQRARRTKAQRGVLRKAYGADFREEFRPEGGMTPQDLAAALQQNPDDPQLQQEWAAMLKARQAALLQARFKLAKPMPMPQAPQPAPRRRRRRQQPVRGVPGAAYLGDGGAAR